MSLFQPLPRRFAAALLVTASLAAAGPASAQRIGDGDGVRLGLTFGGISTIGVSIEYFDGHRSLDLTVGTWSLRDVSASLVVRQYFGSSDLMPFVGGGLWLVGARPRGEQTGFAAVLQAPVGLDWRATGPHYLGFNLNVNRALWVRRTDPEDNLPLNRRLVPLPGLYYRWTR